MFNVGDEIEIVDDTGYFAFCKGSTGKITRINATNYEIVIQGSIQYLSKGDVHHIKLVSSIEVGDTVEYIGTDQKYAGLYGSVTSVGARFFIVQFNALTSKTSVDKYDLKLVSRPVQPSTQSQTQQHTFSTGASGMVRAAKTVLQTANQFYTGGVSFTINEPGKIEYNATKEAGCQHEWRDYIGLSKRMDICTKCPASKNERGIYE